MESYENQCCPLAATTPAAAKTPAPDGTAAPAKAAAQRVRLWHLALHSRSDCYVYAVSIHHYQAFTCLYDFMYMFLHTHT